MASLGLLQMANYLIPVAVIPFVSRALGVEMIGKVSYAQNIIQYFTFLITFGFEYSATKEIAIHKENQEKVREIFWSVIYSKVFLLILSFVLFLGCACYSQRIREDMPLYLSLFAINIGFTFFPTWFFQGREEMKSMSLINFLIKLFGTGLSVFFINSPGDYLIFAIMPSVAYAVFGLASFFYVIRRHQLGAPLFLKDSIVDQCVKSVPIFLNTIFSTLYTIANVTILGILGASDYDLGIYSGAHKIIICVLMVTSMPINVATYPSISRKMAESKEEGIRYFKKIGKWVVLASLSVSLLTYLFCPLMVKILLGHDFLDSIPVLQILSCLPLLVIAASLFTVQGLYGLGFQRYAPFMGAIVGTACILLNCQLIPIYGLYGAAYSWIISEMLEILISGTILYLKTRTL